jgi:hypothetical protein
MYGLSSMFEHVFNTNALQEALWMMRPNGRSLPRHRTGGALAHRKWKRNRASGRA